MKDLPTWSDLNKGVRKMTDKEFDYCEEMEKRKHDEKVRELEAQVEKMKCCGNCKYSNQESVYSIVCEVGGVDKNDYINIEDNQVCDKWEIKD